MSMELFIAKRLFGTRNEGKRVSKPAVTIAQWGVAVGIMVMTASICIIVGFKQQIKEKVIGFGSHIQIHNYYSEQPLVAGKEECDRLLQCNGIAHVQTYINKAGLISTGEELEGVLLKGIGANYDTDFISAHIIDGTMPQFSDTTASGKILISNTTANKLRLKSGDKLNIYFMHNGIKARRLTVAAIYQTHLNEIDEVLAITDIYTTRRLNEWDDNMSTGIEVSIDNYENLEESRDNLLEAINEIAEENNQRIFVQTIEEAEPHLFAWLNLLDQTVWIILILVLGIAGFTMISGLLILILEKTNLIGILKAIGARNISIRKIFLLYAMFIIGRGMIIGNIIGITTCMVQQHTGIVKLDPAMYYMECVPIEFTWWLIPMNIGMFVISTAMLVLPSMLISRIVPTKAIRFE